MARGQYDRAAAKLKREGGDPAPVAPTIETVAVTVEDDFEAVPKRYRLLEAHGFINEYDAVYQKLQGAIISNPIEIEMLMSRGAPLEEV